MKIVPKSIIKPINNRKISWIVTKKNWFFKSMSNV